MRGLQCNKKYRGLFAVRRQAKGRRLSSEDWVVDAVRLEWAERSLVTPKAAPEAEANFFGEGILAGVDAHGLVVDLCSLGHRHQIVGGLHGFLGGEVNDDVLLRRFVAFAIAILDNAEFGVERS